MKKSINRSLLLVLSLMIISCSSKKNVSSTIVKTEDGTTETYEALRIIEKEELSDDGRKIVKKPVIVVVGEGAPVDVKATAVMSAQTRASNIISNSIRQTLTSRFNQKIGVIGTEAATVIRDEINAVSENISNNLKAGKVIVSEKNGLYQVKAEMYIPGDHYVKALKKAGENAKKIISNEEIDNTQKVMKAVDEIFDGNINNLNQDVN